MIHEDSWAKQKRQVGIVHPIFVPVPITVTALDDKKGCGQGPAFLARAVAYDIEATGCCETDARGQLSMALLDKMADTLGRKVPA